jgi:hypothetical protein
VSAKLGKIQQYKGKRGSSTVDDGLQGFFGPEGIRIHVA